MILHREDRQPRMLEPFDGAVVQIQVRDPKLRRILHTALISLHREAVVLSGNLDGSIGETTHRMIPAAVAVQQLVGACPERPRDELMPEADAEYRGVGLGERPD